jgi:hypothetical protein
LVGIEFGVAPIGVGFGLEAYLSVLGKGLAPAADGTRRRVDVAGDLAHTPAGFQQRDGYSASDFEWDFRAFGSHGNLIGEIELSL